MSRSKNRRSSSRRRAYRSGAMTFACQDQIPPQAKIDEAVKTLRELASHRTAKGLDDIASLVGKGDAGCDLEAMLGSFEFERKSGQETPAEETACSKRAFPPVFGNAGEEALGSDRPDRAGPIFPALSRRGELLSLKSIGWVLIAGETATAFVLMLVLVPWLLAHSDQELGKAQLKPPAISVVHAKADIRDAVARLIGSLQGDGPSHMEPPPLPAGR